MPKLNGDQMVAAIRKEGTEIPIIMMSGFGVVMQASNELPPGINVLLPKPVSVKALEEAIAKACGDGQ